MILALFDLQVTLIFPNKFRVNWPSTKFRVNWPFGSEAQNRFSRCLPLQRFWIPIETLLATFDLQVAPILPTKFQVNWLFGSGEAQNRFSRWWPTWVSDVSCFLICKSPWYFLPSFESVGLLVREMKDKIDFQSPWYFLPSLESVCLSTQGLKGKRDFQDGHLWFPIHKKFGYFWSTCCPSICFYLSFNNA